MSDEIAFANTALESFAALVTFVLLFACIAKIKMQRGIKHVTSKGSKEEYIRLYSDHLACDSHDRTYGRCTELDRYGFRKE